MPELFSSAVTGFNTQKAVNFTVTDVFTTGVTMTTPSLPAGTYMVGYAFEMTLDTKDKALSFRLGGTFGSATEFEEAVSAALTGAHKNRAYWFPKEHTGGPITMSLDFKKDASLTTATINFMDVVIQRVA